VVPGLARNRREDADVSERTGQIVETVSIVVIGLAILFYGWALIANLARFPVPAVIALLVVLVLQSGAIRRNLAGGGHAARIRATRDVAFVGAIVLALIDVLWPVRWAVGACVAATEFAIVLELLARFSPHPPAQEAER
jgi:hypothetical protein